MVRDRGTQGRLPQASPHHHPPDEKFDQDKTRHLLEAAGGMNVDLVEEEPEPVKDENDHH
jgi:hypothetical protein